jgi:signal transduction histidine kinase/CheY-like chemotaxis protein
MSRDRLYRYSIRGRAALLTSVLVAAALGAFTWVTITRVQTDLIARGIERAETAVATLAAQTSQTTQQGLNRLTQVASGAAVRNFLRAQNDATRFAVVAEAKSPGASTQEETITIWDSNGRRLLDESINAAARTLPAENEPPSSAGLMPLQTRGEVLFTRSVAEIPSDPAAPGDKPGYLVLSRAVRATANAGLNRVVGDDATVLIGNNSGSVWTDLGRTVPAPQIDLNQPGGREFLSGTGERLIGATAEIPGTPWVLLIAFPRDVILAPSWQLLGVLSVASLVIVALATVAARSLSRRVTEPLAELTRAVQAMEQGDYSRRVLAQRQDEVGELTRAFNAMAHRVESGRHALEAHAQELSASREAARRANASKDEFLAVLSHELRTPLNAILGWCQMLQSGVTPPGGTTHGVAVIERNAMAQLRLIEDLLDVSRIVTGQFVLEKQRVDLHDVVTTAVESVQPTAAAKNISLVTHPAPPASQRSVHGDASRLQQAVWNLLSNAVKFTPAGGAIHLEMHARTSGIEIAIRDNGQGISAAALPVIFDRLQQGDNGAARKHGGLGLGLAIVRQIVELHHGTVSAESDGPGRGATFRILLPTISSSPAATSMPDSPRALPSSDAVLTVTRPLAGRRILLVEDSADARDVMELLLTNAGAVVAMAADGAAGLEWLASHTTDIIVSDIGMPGMDGWEMIRRFRALPIASAAAVPAVALTAHVTPADRERSRAAGFQEHLAKPVDIDELFRVITRLVPSP